MKKLLMKVVRYLESVNAAFLPDTCCVRDAAFSYYFNFNMNTPLL